MSLMSEDAGVTKIEQKAAKSICHSKSHFFAMTLQNVTHPQQYQNFDILFVSSVAFGQNVAQTQVNINGMLFF